MIVISQCGILTIGRFMYWYMLSHTRHTITIPVPNRDSIQGGNWVLVHQTAPCTGRTDIASSWYQYGIWYWEGELTYASNKLFFVPFMEEVGSSCLQNNENVEWMLEILTAIELFMVDLTTQWIVCLHVRSTTLMMNSFVIRLIRG